jgi:hypothetical protein
MSTAFNSATDGLHSNRVKPLRFHLSRVLGLVLAVCVVAAAADKKDATKEGQDIKQLKTLLADQQRQIQELRAALQEQRKLIERSTPTPVLPRLGEVASTTAMVPPAPAAPAAKGGQFSEEPASPLQIHIGEATLTPVGFMDFTSVFRSTGTGNGIGTNFGSVPFSNTTNGHLSEFRTSAQNSRLGLRLDTKVKGANVLGYMESDFLGFVPANAAVSSNSDTLRLRLFWVDIQKSKVELFAGQSWSMLTPNRLGLSALPGDLFFTQLIDTNYQAGLVWSRNPQFRLIVHPIGSVAMGVSLESPEQYIGGSGGGGVVTLPSALATAYASQLNNGGTTLSVPNAHPDIVSKIAFDRNTSSGRHQHVEVAGLFRTFKAFNPLAGHLYENHGFGGSLNFNLELVKGFHLISNNFVSDGGGRWIFGLAPDLIVRPDGSLSPVHANATVDGIEYQFKKSLFYGYWGGVYIRKNVALEPATGKWIGYGYPGSGSGQNRLIQEPCFGLTQTFWKNPKFGALQTIIQYSYASRDPWFVPTDQPASAHVHMIFADLRYVLPGSAPRVEK